jgi:putative ABC transport system substrate-binding protein
MLSRFLPELFRTAPGVVLGTGSSIFNCPARIGASALGHKLPAISYIAEEVPYGLLLSYGQDFPDYVRRAVAYADKILKGANPADLPIEQPTKLKLVLERISAGLNRDSAEDLDRRMWWH